MADVNQRGQYGRTPIWRAAFGGHADMIRLLLKNGADPRMEAQGEAPIINASGEAKEALEKWDIAETEKLLVKYHQQREMLQKAESEKGKQQLKALESELAKAEKNDEAAQVWQSACRPPPPPAPTAGEGGEGGLWPPGGA